MNIGKTHGILSGIRGGFIRVLICPVFSLMKATHPEVPLCPVHRIAMRLLPAMPELKVGPKASQVKVSERRQYNSWRRFRCPVEGCARVAAIPTESTNESAD
jgi:hypothetical protein